MPCTPSRSCPYSYGDNIPTYTAEDALPRLQGPLYPQVPQCQGEGFEAPWTFERKIVDKTEKKRNVFFCTRAKKNASSWSRAPHMFPAQRAAHVSCPVFCSRSYDRCLGLHPYDQVFTPPSDRRRAVHNRCYCGISAAEKKETLK